MGFVENMDIIFKNSTSNSTVGMRLLIIVFVYIEGLTVYDMAS